MTTDKVEELVDELLKKSEKAKKDLEAENETA